VHLQHIWLQDFRCYQAAELTLTDDLTAIVGDNGQGKSSLLEAVSYLATLRSFRGVPTEALVRQGTTASIVRAEGERDHRTLLIEAEISSNGRNRVQVNRQRLQRTRDLLGFLRVSVFAPDDLELVKSGPGIRRNYLDDTLVALNPSMHQSLSDLERVLRQRNTLLRQARGRLTTEIETTLDVWDTQLAQLGDTIAAERVGLVDQLAPLLNSAYASVAGQPVQIGVIYEPTWLVEGLADALARVRVEDLRRQVTTMGPHRDDVWFTVAGLPARTHASQGEQRSLALALRLAAHDLVSTVTGSSPVLLLDDVFSELDPQRSDALVASLPPGQTLLTTAGALPSGVTPDQTLRVVNGELFAV
jgi:DNA replication and repair protein RecF